MSCELISAKQDGESGGVQSLMGQLDKRMNAAAIKHSIID